MSSASESETSARIRKAQAGDLDALVPVIAQMTPLLRAQARYRLGPHLSLRIDADDLVQSAWLVALRKLSALEPRDGRLGGVLFRFLATTIVRETNAIARRVARMMAAGAKIDAAAESTRVSGRRHGPQVMNPTISSGFGADEHRLVAVAIEDLSDDDRNLLIMRIVEDAPWALIGNTLRISEEAARKRLTRLLEDLRRRFGRSIFDEVDAG